MKVGFIGFGNMAQALAEGFAATGALKPCQIGACARDRAKLRRNTEPKGFLAFDDAARVAEFADMVIVAVKPHQVDSQKAAAKGGKASAAEITMSAQEIRQRIYALFAVFGVVIFFWVSFHQNGYSLTYFARDYVNLDVINIDLGFTVIKGAEIFQSVNPFFVVTLTPLIMWFFGWLRKRNVEVSTPMKIAIGMGIAATAYLFLMFFSLALPDKAALAGMKADEMQSILVTPWVMVGLYFILTVAELFISPLGLAFVSKVAPPHMQGLMQGFWLAATAVGNALLFVGGWLYLHTPMWATWFVFVAACGLSMLVMLSMVRWLERVTR